MNTPSPLIWHETPGAKYCVLTALRNVDDSQEISKGISRAQGFPSDAYFKMDKNFKKQVALSDSLANIAGIRIVSERLKTFIESHAVTNVEFLRVTIIDHKDKEVSAPYYILNPLSVVDCIDIKQSKLKWNNIDRDLIAFVTKLVLDIKAIDPAVLMFRAKHMEEHVFVREDLAQAIQAGPFTGIAFTEPPSFVG